MDDDQVTRNFTLAEFITSETATRLGIDNRPPPAVLAQLRNVTIPAMQAVRDLLGVVVLPSSGYRCQDLERALKRKPATWTSTSQHVLGEACDFIAPAFGTPLEVAQWLQANLARLQIDQLIWEGPWVHASWSSNPRGEVLTAHFGAGGQPTYSRGLAPLR